MEKPISITDLTLYKDKFDTHYKAVFHMNGVHCESITIHTIPEYAKKFGMTEKEIKSLIKK